MHLSTEAQDTQSDGLGYANGGALPLGVNVRTLVTAQRNKVAENPWSAGPKMWVRTRPKPRLPRAMWPSVALVVAIVIKQSSSHQIIEQRKE